MISTPCSRTVPNRTATQLVPTRPHRPPMSRRSPTICIKASLRPSKTYQRSLRGSQKHHSLNAPQHPAPSSNPHRDRRTCTASHPAISGLGASPTPGNPAAKPHITCNGVRETCTLSAVSQFALKVRNEPKVDIMILSLIEKDLIATNFISDSAETWPFALASIQA